MFWTVFVKTTTHTNLNVGLGLTQLLLYTSTLLSNSTRENDPRGLKFGMQPHPHPDIQTTTQHNV